MAGTGGVVPQTTTGVATPGNPFYHVGITGAASNALTVLGVSLNVLPAPDPLGILLDQTALVLPSSQFGTFQTNSAGQANWSFGLPPAPTLTGQLVYLQWGVLDPGVANGYSLTPARKVVFW